jgi:hypothetical protein
VTPDLRVVRRPFWTASRLNSSWSNTRAREPGTGYQRVMHHKLGSPAEHIAALGEFADVLRGG